MREVDIETFGPANTAPVSFVTFESDAWMIPRLLITVTMSVTGVRPAGRSSPGRSCLCRRGDDPPHPREARR